MKLLLCGLEISSTTNFSEDTFIIRFRINMEQMAFKDSTTINKDHYKAHSFVINVTLKGISQISTVCQST